MDGSFGMEGYSVISPIRETIQAHKEFWEYKIGSKNLEDSILDEEALKCQIWNYI